MFGFFVIAFGGDLTIPDDGAGRLVWGVILAVLVATYFVISRARRRATEHYIESKRRAAELRANDPDMAKPEPEIDKGD